MNMFLFWVVWMKLVFLHINLDVSEFLFIKLNDFILVLCEQNDDKHLFRAVFLS